MAGKGLTSKTGPINIPQIELEEIDIHLIGSAALIVHAFPEKARKEMLGKQMKIAKGGRDARDPYAEVEAAKYVLPGKRHGFPAVAFKAAAVTACTSLADVTKVAARQAFRIAGESMKINGVLEGSFIRTALVPLYATPPVIREDVVRLSGIGRTPEMRYRPEYADWGVKLRVQINKQVMSYDQLLSMFHAAGMGVGVGDYRPEKDGDCGTFDVVGEDEWLKWLQENKITEHTAATDDAKLDVLRKKHAAQQNKAARALTEAEEEDVEETV